MVTLSVKAGDYYKPQPGERPEDFKMRCGGELIYKEDIASKTDDNGKLPHEI